MIIFVIAVMRLSISMARVGTDGRRKQLLLHVLRKLLYTAALLFARFRLSLI